MGAIIRRIMRCCHCFIDLLTQHQEVLEGSREGTLPKTKELTNLQFYISDSEGNHSYTIEQHSDAPRENIRAWSRLLCLKPAKTYIQKRRRICS